MFIKKTLLPHGLLCSKRTVGVASMTAHNRETGTGRVGPRCVSLALSPGCMLHHPGPAASKRLLRPVQSAFLVRNQGVSAFEALSDHSNQQPRLTVTRTGPTTPVLARPTGAQVSSAGEHTSEVPGKELRAKLCLKGSSRPEPGQALHQWVLSCAFPSRLVRTISDAATTAA